MVAQTDKQCQKQELFERVRIMLRKIEKVCKKLNKVIF